MNRNSSQKVHDWKNQTNVLEMFHIVNDQHLIDFPKKVANLVLFCRLPHNWSGAFLFVDSLSVLSCPCYYTY